MNTQQFNSEARRLVPLSYDPNSLLSVRHSSHHHEHPAH